MKYPISPEYIQAAGEYLTPLYQNLEDFIIEKICEQFQTGEANATAIELIRELQRRGLDLTEIEKRIMKTLGISRRELDSIFQDAIMRNELYYGDVLDKMDLAGDSYQFEAMRLEADAIARQTIGEFVNLTRSMGFAMQDLSGQVSFMPIQKAYQTALDRAAVRVLSGAESYDVAIREAVKSLSDSGLQVVDYESGHHDRIDVAVRRAVMTGVTQISSKYTEQISEDVPTPYREVSAHSGARDIDKPNPWSNHKAWQGKVYSLKSGDIYPNIYSVCGWGEVDGLEGANCRHVHYPFWEGISERTYTDQELADIDPKPFMFEGKEYNAYQATQQQRKIERALRAVKRRYLGENAAGIDSTATAVKYRRLNEEYDKFNKASGLRPQKERANIREFGPKEAKEALEQASDTKPAAPASNPATQNTVANPGIFDKMDSEKADGVVAVHTVGKINKDVYSCVSKDIITDEVIITDKQIQHIQENHNNAYDKYGQYFREIVEHPDYIIESEKPKTAYIMKEIIDEENKKFKSIMRLATSTDNPDYKNSIITFMRISDKEWKRILKNKKILYKRET